MNLHIVPDDKFISRLIDRIEAIGALSSNQFVVKAKPPFRHVKQAWVKGAQPNTTEFSSLTGNLSSYEKIFVHFMDDAMIQWVVQNDLRNIYWMPWGADIYESRFSGFHPNDALTEQVLAATLRNRVNRFLMNTYQKIKQRSSYIDAYSRVGFICNWIYDEYKFAEKHLPGLKSEHRFFIYDVDVPFDQLASQRSQRRPLSKTSLRVQLGQSTTSAGNHASALRQLKNVGAVSEVVIPASYGSDFYASRLEQWVQNQKFPFKIQFSKEYIPFDKYVDSIDTFDVLILNSIRPAGMGNFWLGILLGKILLLRKENLVTQMMKELGLTFYYIDEWSDNVQFPTEQQLNDNIRICLEFFNEDRIRSAYRNLFL